MTYQDFIQRHREQERQSRNLAFLWLFLALATCAIIPLAQPWLQDRMPVDWPTGMARTVATSIAAAPFVLFLLAAVPLTRRVLHTPELRCPVCKERLDDTSHIIATGSCPKCHRRLEDQDASVPW